MVSVAVKSPMFPSCAGVIRPRSTFEVGRTIRSVATGNQLVLAFSSLARSLGECSAIHSPSALFIFLKWRLVRAHLFHTLGQDQSTVAQRAETRIAERSLTSACESVSWKVLTLCLDSGIVNPLRLRWVKGVCVF